MASSAGASIAVIVPVLNESARLAALLEDLSRRDFAQIIVVDGESDDDTVEIASRCAGATLVRGPRGRGVQLNKGAAAAGADLLLFLHADTQLPDDAATHIRCVLRDDGVAAGCFRLTFDTAHPLLWLYAKSTALDSFFTTFGDQAFFMRASTFRAAGGFPEWPFLEDVGLRRQLKRAGRFVKADAAVVTSARRFQAGGIARQQLRNGLILFAFLFGVPAVTLARWYAAPRAPKR